MKQRLLGMAAVIAVAGLSSLFTSRRIEAQYSAPVKVMNTTSAPALNSTVDDHGRIPYWSEVDGGTPISGQDCHGGCTFTFGPVPSGHRVVVERMSAALDLSGGAVAAIFVGITPTTVAVGKPTTHASFVAPPTELFDVPTLFYVDSQQSYTISIVASGGAPMGISNHVILHGYMLDCTAAPCAAIAN